MKGRRLFVLLLFAFLGACSESASDREIGDEPAAASAAPHWAVTYTPQTLPTKSTK